MELLIPFFILLGVAGIVAFLIARSVGGGELERLRALSLANVDAMTGIEFEHYVAALLVNEGFRCVNVTPPSGDNGVDITAERGVKKYSIQVKRHAGSVSRRAVSDAVAGMLPYGCNACMVITNSHLSVKALDFARVHQCEVVGREVLSEWILRFQKTSLHSANTASAQIDEITPSLASQREQAQDVAGAFENRSEQGKRGVVPTAVFNEIKAYAAKEHPGDYSTMEYVINLNVTAYLELQQLRAARMPVDLYEKVLSELRIDHPADYSTQLYVIEGQIKSYHAILDMPKSRVPQDAMDEILSLAKRDYPFDFSTQLYVINENLQAYEKIQRMG